MILNIPDELEYEIQADKIRFALEGHATDWMSCEDSFIRRIDRENLNEELISKHLAKEIEIRNVLDRGAGFLNASKYPKAVEMFDEVLFYDESYGEALLYKSYGLRGQKHFVKALRNYRRAVRADESLKDTEYYKTLLREANNERDSFPKLKMNIYTGDEFFAKGEYSKAIASYDRALMNPSKFKDKILSKLLNKKATALVKLEMYEDALKCFEKSFDVDGNDYSVFGMGLCQFSLKRDVDVQFKNRLEITKRQMLKQVIILNDLGFYADALAICDFLCENHFKKDEFYFKMLKAREVSLRG